MITLISPTKITKDPRAHAESPISHVPMPEWPNLIAYVRQAKLFFPRQKGHLSIKCVFEGEETYTFSGNCYESIAGPTSSPIASANMPVVSNRKSRSSRCVCFSGRISCRKCSAVLCKQQTSFWIVHIHQCPN